MTDEDRSKDENKKKAKEYSQVLIWSVLIALIMIFLHWLG